MLTLRDRQVAPGGKSGLSEGEGPLERRAKIESVQISRRKMMSIDISLITADAKMKMPNGAPTTRRGRKSAHGLTSILFAGGKPRSALLAGASTIAFAALGCPAVEAACFPSPQTISILNYPGPIISNGGDITVNSGASVAGGPTGVYASSCGIGALSNSGEISGLSPAAAPAFGGIGLLVNLGQTIGSLTNWNDGTIYGGSGRGTSLNTSAVAGGAGVLNAGTITSLTNGGVIGGGYGGVYDLHNVPRRGGFGAAALSNTGSIATLTNTGIISGGGGGYADSFAAGAGGAGVFNAGTITTLTNTGIIAGGGGADGTRDTAVAGNNPGGGAGGAGVSNAANEAIVSLSNETAGTINGGAGGDGEYSPGGAGGAGVSNSGAIGALTNSGAISGGNGGVILQGYVIYGYGGAGGAGVSNNGLIFTLTNSGAISGGNGGNGGSGGAGVSNYGAILTLTNSGMIGGGSGGGGAYNAREGGAGLSNASGANIALLANLAAGTISGGQSFFGDPGGAGVSNAGTVMELTNLGKIGGGIGGAGDGYDGGVGGAGVSNSGAITILTNGGAIEGGVAGNGFNAGGGAGGAGVSNKGTITTLTNSGAIGGGNGGNGDVIAFLGGSGGAGLSNAGTIITLTNSGAISGGNGGNGGLGGGAGGAGVSNTGTIGAVINSGVIAGGTNPFGYGGAAGYAIISAGPSASIGAITNSGQITGNVEIDNQASVAIYGGTGAAYGSWTGGAITVGYRLTFAGGNTALGDSVTFNGGAGTVFNNGPLMVSTPITINGGFDQRSGGELDFLISGDTAGQYGTLHVTGSTMLDGVVVVDLASGFHLAGGETFDLLTSSGALMGGLDGVSIDGYGCSATEASGLWLCNGGGLYLDLAVVTGANGLVELTTAAAIPELSIWAMLATGFLSLAFIDRRNRAMQPAA